MPEKSSVSCSQVPPSPCRCACDCAAPATLAGQLITLLMSISHLRKSRAAGWVSVGPTTHTCILFPFPFSFIFNHKLPP